jgi:hypothetical protein
MPTTNNNNTMTIKSTTTKNLFTTLTKVTVEFEDGFIEKGEIVFIPNFFYPAYYEEETNFDGWAIHYPEWFMGGNAPDCHEYTHLGEMTQIGDGVYQADDTNFGKITIRVA